MTFKGCTTAAQIIWDWGWVWKSTIVDSVDVGFRLVSDDGAGFIGSVAFMDSKFSNIGKAAIIMSAPADKAGQASTGLVLDNVNLGGNVVDNSTNKVLGSGYYQNVCSIPWILVVLLTLLTSPVHHRPRLRQQRQAHLAH